MTIFAAMMLNGNPLPVDPYDMPAITEVKQDTTGEWSVEIDGYWFLDEFPETVFPCSAIVFVIVDNGNAPVHADSVFCDTVVFNEEEIGVLTLGPMMIFPRREPVLVTDTSVIYLMNQKMSGPIDDENGLFWKFPLKRVSPGNSLIYVNGRTGRMIMETCRPSIGRRSILQTQYTWWLTDSYGRPLAHILPDGPGIFYIPDSSSIPSGAKASDAAGMVKFTLAIGDPPRTVRFVDRESGHYEGSLYDGGIPQFDVTYVDSAAQVAETLSIPVTHYRLTLVNEDGVPPADMDVYHCAPNGHTTMINKRLVPHVGRNGVWDLRVYKDEDTVSFCFNVAGCYTNKYGCMNSWQGVYVDTADTLFDTLVVSEIVATGVRAAPPPLTGVGFNTILSGSSRLRIMISTSHHLPKAVVSLVTIDGKDAGSMPVQTGESGTYTFLWKTKKRGERLVSGTYICRLLVGGSPVAARTVSIR